MALHLNSQILLRSVVHRCGYLSSLQQSRTLCKGPPDETTSNQVSSAGDGQSSGSDSDEEIKQKDVEHKGSSLEHKLIQENKPTEGDQKAAAKRKLNNLLISLAMKDPLPAEPVPKIQLSKPMPRPKPEKKKKEVVDDGIITAGPESEEIHIESELVAAAKDVAESLGGDVQTTESELLSTLRSHSTESSIEEKQTTNLSELFVGMKIEREQSKPRVEQRWQRRYDHDLSKPEQIAYDEEFQQRKPSLSQPRRRKDPITVDLFGSKPLGIFGVERLKGKESAAESSLAVWDAAHQRELKMSVSHPPANAFLEMIQWTKQGKLWTFPIDNEMGLEEEKKIGFHEHIFLEHHLEGWCPKRGPIRHFMELVCVGLSKNSHLTVERKKRHIEWYKNYFEAKQDILREVGAIEAGQ